MKTTTKRIAGLDTLRAIAIFLVIFVHFFLNTKFYKTPLHGWNMIIQTYLRWSVLVSVPTFLLLTGYLNINKEINKKFYKGISKVISAYLFYSILAIIYRITFLNETQTTYEWIMGVFHFDALGYAWYVEMYIGLFLLIPFLNRLYHALIKKRNSF
jgi:surface polysaccharide O-acyltransferase-like enzyme